MDTSYFFYSWVFLKTSTIWLRNSLDPIGCHGRTASYPTAPARIPACGTTALGSSETLASVKVKSFILSSLLFPAGRFAFVPPVQQSGKCYPLQATYSVSPFPYGYPFQCNTRYRWLARPYPTRTFTLQDI